MCVVVVELMNRKGGEVLRREQVLQMERAIQEVEEVCGSGDCGFFWFGSFLFRAVELYFQFRPRGQQMIDVNQSMI